MRLCARGLELAATVAAHSARAASADVQLAIALLQAGFIGARGNLEAKLSSFTDAAYVRSVVDEIARLGEEIFDAVGALAVWSCQRHRSATRQEFKTRAASSLQS